MTAVATRCAARIFVRITRLPNSPMKSKTARDTKRLRAFASIRPRHSVPTKIHPARFRSSRLAIATTVPARAIKM